jgi:hypothetical protein
VLWSFVSGPEVSDSFFCDSLMECEVVELDSDIVILEFEGMENNVPVSKKDDRDKYEDDTNTELSMGLFYDEITNFVSVFSTFFIHSSLLS